MPFLWVQLLQLHRGMNTIQVNLIKALTMWSSSSSKPSPAFHKCFPGTAIQVRYLECYGGGCWVWVWACHISWLVMRYLTPWHQIKFAASHRTRTRAITFRISIIRSVDAAPKSAWSHFTRTLPPTAHNLMYCRFIKTFHLQFQFRFLIPPPACEAASPGKFCKCKEETKLYEHNSICCAMSLIES